MWGRRVSLPFSEGFSSQSAQFSAISFQSSVSSAQIVHWELGTDHCYVNGSDAGRPAGITTQRMVTSVGLTQSVG